MPPPFHLAFTVDDLEAARAFWCAVMGAAEGRSAASWVDVDFHGHQLSLHLGPRAAALAEGEVDGEAVPMPHFGVVLDVAAFHDLARRLEAAGRDFLIEPRLRFPGAPGEQWTMFFADPAGNAVEIKAYTDPGAVFARDDASAGTGQAALGTTGD